VVVSWLVAFFAWRRRPRPSTPPALPALHGPAWRLELDRRRRPYRPAPGGL